MYNIDSIFADRCVCCGKPVPEGRIVCPICENGGTPIPPTGTRSSEKKETE